MIVAVFLWCLFSAFATAFVVTMLQWYGVKTRVVVMVAFVVTMVLLSIVIGVKWK